MALPSIVQHYFTEIASDIRTNFLERHHLQAIIAICILSCLSGTCRRGNFPKRREIK
jgi:hypothetical protein